MSRIVAAEFEGIFEQARRDAGQKSDYRLLAADWDEIIETQPSVGARANVPQKLPITLAEAYDRFVDDPTRRRAARTRLAHVTTRRVIEELLGPDTPLVQITRDDCRSVLETLRFLPVNHSKMAAGMTVQKAVDLARSDPATRTINSTNLNAYMARFSAMMNWAVSEEIIERNPARGLQVAHAIQPRDRRKPFDVAQLRAIFGAPIYTGCRDEFFGYAVKGEVIASGARFWVPLIGLWTGMRLNEICQLDVTDIRSLDGVDCFVITTKSLVGATDKSLKTVSSERIVPIHPQLQQIGFLAFVDRKKGQGSKKLFDDLPQGATGFRSVAFSRWFGRFLKRVGITDPLICFHSFRHGFRDACRNSAVDRDIALRLGGWITGRGHSDSAENYGSGYRPSVLCQEIQKLDFQSLDLSHLSFKVQE